MQRFPTYQFCYEKEWVSIAQVKQKISYVSIPLKKSQVTVSKGHLTGIQQIIFFTTKKSSL